MDFLSWQKCLVAFLDFEREEELERISRNLCRYHQPGEISRKKGYLVHEMADHARVVVARPDFAENWMFFIRKLDNIPEVSLQRLVTGGHAEIPVELFKMAHEGLSGDGGHRNAGLW